MKDIKELKSISNKIRKATLASILSANSGHPGGSLSCTDIITALYFEIMNINPENPKWEDRDRFILSKGHCAPALYSALALRGFFPYEELKTLRKLNSKLQGHPDMQKTKGIDISSGSLGQGLSIACGIALAGNLNNKNYYTYILLGDGEIQEGQVWEAAMSASHYKLNHIIAFIDNNNLQIDGEIDKVMSPYPIGEKFKAFGWNVIDIDGHNFEQILNSVDNAKKETKKPTVIICKTIKGKGVPFMENQAGWHGKAPSEEQFIEAINTLDKEVI